ncbi:hypothetical protein HGG64_00775 [Mycoplasma phocoeninasale]|uniref:Variable surface lipoprotein n=1 Tax=Mycoplasma phocoeninasale TaxID=2726117 RepID=A0A858U620_9MOLU|nr:hypothetical protein [Mycoplasma phocoeninasale]QJG66248.1 hypothetical protein HGG64_00775 [Mycoplasma phocoeninasale]
MKKNLKWLVIMPISVFSLPMIAAACENKKDNIEPKNPPSMDMPKDPMITPPNDSTPQTPPKMDMPPKKDAPQTPPSKDVPKNPMPTPPNDSTPQTPPAEDMPPKMDIPNNPNMMMHEAPKPTPPPAKDIPPKKEMPQTPPKSTPPETPKNPLDPMDMNKPNIPKLEEKDKLEYSKQVLYLNLWDLHKNKTPTDYDFEAETILNNLFTKKYIEGDVFQNGKILINDLKNARKENKISKVVDVLVKSAIGSDKYSTYINFLDEKEIEYIRDFRVINDMNRFDIFNKFWREIRENDSPVVDYKVLFFLDYVLTYDRNTGNLKYNEILELIKKALENKTNLTKQEVEQINMIVKKQK